MSSEKLEKVTFLLLCNMEVMTFCLGPYRPLQEHIYNKGDLSMEVMTFAWHLTGLYIRKYLHR